MSSFAKLYASMENEEEVVDAVPEVTTDDIVEAQEVTEEVAAAGAEVEEVQEAIEEGVADAETLETVADTLEETVEDGGADPATAQMAEVAVESIYRRLGIEAKAMPALEAFNDKEQRITATKLAVEGIREKAKKIWDTIVAFFKNLFQKVSEWFKSLKNYFKSSRKQIVDADDRIRKFSKKETVTITDGVANSLVGNFYNVVKEDSLSKLMDRTNTFLAYYKDMEKMSEILTSSVIPVSMVADDAEPDVAEAAFKALSAVASLGDEVTNAVGKKLGLDTKSEKAILLKDTVVGNKAVVLVITSDKELKNYGMKVRTVTAESKKISKIKVSYEEVARFAAGALKANSFYEGVNVEKFLATPLAAINKMGAEISRMADKKAKQDDGEEASKNLRLIQKLVTTSGTAINSALVSGMGNVSSIITKAPKIVNEYINAVNKNSKEAVKEEE